MTLVETDINQAKKHESSHHILFNNCNLLVLASMNWLAEPKDDDVPDNDGIALIEYDEEKKCDDGDETVKLLLQGGENVGKKENVTPLQIDTAAAADEAKAEESPIPGFTFSVRVLAYATLVLLIGSQLLLQQVCLASQIQRASSKKPIFKKWYVATDHTALIINASPRDDGGWLAEVEPGDAVGIIHDEHGKFHHVVEPVLGWTRKRSLITGNAYFKQQQEDKKEPWSWCPLEYSGMPKEFGFNKYFNAPGVLVIGQTLWNATQVLHLFLMICVCYDFLQGTDRITATLSYRRTILVCSICLASALLLPFSVYLMSPGAHLFAIMSLALTLVTILTPVSNLRLSIGEYGVEPAGDEDVKPWFLIHEETVCALCYLGSSLYNSAAGSPVKKWPHFNRWWKHMDHFFALQNEGDVTPLHRFFKMGRESVLAPPYVSRAYTSTTAAHVFLFVWSILPTLYVFNFVIMIAMSRHSPTGKWVQRVLATFGAIHFLFWTDVVSYKYGRGYRNEHEDFFHWTEKWSWRIGIMIPLYQNVTNGHWGPNAHRCFPIVGRLMRYGVIVWLCGFFVFQTLQADLIRTYEFLMDEEDQGGLIRMYGYGDVPMFKKLRYPYFTALVWMWMMYGLLHITGFKLYRISLRRAVGQTNTVAATNSDEESKSLFDGLLAKPHDS